MKMKDQEAVMQTAFQDYYPEGFAHCFGCGRLNERGLHVRSYWLDEAAGEAVAWFTPSSEHTGGYPGFVYGGLIAALLDCHGNGTAAAAGYAYRGRPLGSLPALRFVTAHLSLDYLRPTPMGCPLELRARVAEISERKVRLELSLRAEGVETVRAEMVCVLLREASGK